MESPVIKWEKAFLATKNKPAGIITPDFKIYYIIVAIKQPGVDTKNTYEWIEKRA